MTLARPVPAAGPAPIRTPQIRLPGKVTKIFTVFGGWLSSVGAAVLFTLGALARLVKPPFRFGELVEAMAFAGVGSLGIILLTGAFTGAVFAVQTSVALNLFGAKGLVGGSVALSLLRELAPTLGALMMAGRVGSSITTELGTMRVTEQIDALESMAVDPVQYLVGPRILACVLAMPMLGVAFAAIGILGAYLVSVASLNIDSAQFTQRIYLWVVPSDILCTLVKSAVFGLLIGIVSTWKGFYAQGGSRGVGLATTSTVVTSSVLILLFDYVLTNIWLRAFPPTGSLM